MYHNDTNELREELGQFWEDWVVKYTIMKRKTEKRYRPNESIPGLVEIQVAK